MRDNYDFSASVRNPYAAQLKKQIMVGVDAATVDYFKQQAEETGIPCHTLINFYLAECARSKKRLTWT